MMWTGRADEAGALGLLLDRTYAEVAAAAARPRSLDREFLIGQFELWTHHLLPALVAGSAPPWTRQAAARAVWRGLGVAAGAGHRRWMAAHLDGLGLDPDALLGPARDDRTPSSDTDRVPQPLTAALTGAGYDLTGGAVAGARVEVHGPDPVRMGGFLRLAPGRRRDTEDGGGDSVLHFCFGDATSFVLAHAERGAVRLSGRPAVVVTPEEVSLAVPASGVDLRLAGRDLGWYPDDPLGPEPAATDAGGTAPELPELRARGLDVVGTLQLMVMEELRLIRSAGLLRRWELASAGALCGGLNAELFRVAPASLRARRAARRLRTMAATDDGLARAFLRRVGRRLPIEVPELPGPVPPAPVRITVGTAGRLFDDVDFTGGRLRLVEVAADGRSGLGGTVIHLDAHHGGRDTIVVIVLSEPLGCAPLTVTPDGLSLTRRPTLHATADDITLTLALPGGDWTVRAAAGSWYVD